MFTTSGIETEADLCKDDRRQGREGKKFFLPGLLDSADQGGSVLSHRFGGYGKDLNSLVENAWWHWTKVSQLDFRQAKQLEGAVKHGFEAWVTGSSLDLARKQEPPVKKTIIYI